jgi:hypothetical protein
MSRTYAVKGYEPRPTNNGNVCTDKYGTPPFESRHVGVTTRNETWIERYVSSGYIFHQMFFLVLIFH